MFGKLKNKLKEWATKVSEVEEVEKETLKQVEETEENKKKGFLKKLFSKKIPDYYLIYRAGEKDEKEISENVSSLKKEYPNSFAYSDIMKDNESREEMVEKFKEKIKEFSESNPKMKFVIDYSYGIGRMMKQELAEAKKHGFEIIEINKPKEKSKKESKKEAKDKKITKLTPKETTRDLNGMPMKAGSRIDPVVETSDIEKTTDKEIDKKLKKELNKGHYKEAKKKFNEGAQSYYPDLEKTIIKERQEEVKPKSGFFKKLLSSKKTITEEQFTTYSEDLEMILLENNVALEVSDKIIEELKNNIVGIELSKKEIEEKIINILKIIIESVLLEPFDIIKEIKDKDGPYVMIFCGINGVGKTTSIAKFANMLKVKGLTSVMAAGDTFRAAAIEQLKVHGSKLDIKVIAHEYGSDPAAVGFDAVKYAKKNNIDVVLIDTAGRIHTATNLLQEMAKIKKVCKPDRTIFLGESITGNDAVDQVKAFNENIGIDAIILSKADIDEKGGTALSVGYVTQKPILFLGTGQEYDDIEPFDKKKFIEKLGL